MSVNLGPVKMAFVSRAAAAFVALCKARDQLVALRAEWDALGYSTAIVDADFVAPNDNLNAATLAAGFTSQGNLETFWAAGNNTNLEKFRNSTQ